MAIGRLLAAVLAAAVTASDAGRAEQRTAADPNLVARGRYLARAADCMPCHTAAADKPYAGGLKLNTPFGAIYSPNVTPDRETGIGAWTFDQFKGALHSGIRADGKYLYPAMPFDAFTRIADDDLAALFAYFRSLAPIKQRNRADELSFPINIRYAMLAWRMLFFRAGSFQPDPAKSAQWNRGAYLVEALGHCGDCHTPRNFLGATVASRRFEGAKIDQWYAPNITAEAIARTNRWDKSQLIAFLRKGAANNSTALGPMQEVVHDSLSYLTPHDLDAMADYLMEGQQGGDARKPPRPAQTLAPAVAARAARLYADHCASCHQSDGRGIAGSIPPLAGNPAATAAEPYDTLTVVLEGIPARGGLPAMPSFAGSLNDGDVAGLANYVRTSFGNRAAPNATAEQVAAWRSTLSLPGYAGDPARRFDCPNVGGGGSLDPKLIAAFGDELANRSIAYATLIDAYKASNPGAGMAAIVNDLVAAYCPIVARSDRSDQAKRLAVKRFALNITSYLSEESAGATEPDAGIIRAVPAGHSLAERDPPWRTALKCPPNDNSRVPQTLVAAAVRVLGAPKLDFLAPDAVAQADRMLADNPKARFADLANALILAYCEGVAPLAGVREAEKIGALTRYGQEVIEALQGKAEAIERAPAANAAR